MDDREPVLLGQLVHPLHRLADVRAVEDDLGAVLEARRDLRRHGAGGHHDRHRHARLATGPRVGLARVAGRDRDRAAAPLVGRQRLDPRQRRARLERAGLLEMLGLEVQLPVGEPGAARLARDPGRGRRRQQRRVVDPVAEPGTRLANSVEGHGSRAHGRSIRRWIAASVLFAFLRNQ